MWYSEIRLANEQIKPPHIVLFYPIATTEYKLLNA
jgi:hypothetical protein